MKALVEISDEGLESLLGEKVLLLCANYFYTGTLIGVNADCVKLKDPAIVYETGKWDEPTYADCQPLHVKEFYVNKSAIEAYGKAK